MGPREPQDKTMPGNGLANDGPVRAARHREGQPWGHLEAIERVFFHDLPDAAGALRGFMQMWPLFTAEEAVEASQAAARLSRQIVEEIETERDLAAAERGDLEVRVNEIDAGAFLDDLRVLYAHHRAAGARRLTLVRSDAAAPIRTDRVLLARVIA